MHRVFSVSEVEKVAVKSDAGLEKVRAWEAYANIPGAIAAQLRRNAGALAAKVAPKGSRALPNTYLDVGYISRHLAKFDNGGSWLVPTDVLDQFGRVKIGRPDGQFMAPKGEIDALLARANGDISIIERELGIPAGSWQGKQLSRIDVPNTSAQNRRIPSGNEAGANDEWLPGGITSGGKSEAVIDQVNQGDYVETLIN